MSSSSTEPLLTRALAHLEKEKYEPALKLLVEAWQKSREPAIADAVEAVDRALHLPALTKEAMKTWDTAAQETTAAAQRGPFIRAINSMTTTEILDSLSLIEKKEWDDPRVGTLLIAMLKELRFSGNRSKPFWRPLFDKIPSLRDPRFADLVDTLPKTWSVGPSMQKWLTNQLKEAATFSIEASTPSATLASIATLAQSKERSHSVVGEHAGGISGESLLADLHANPSDDAARSVYADWLLERGDPRGEFISIQLRTEKDKDALKRERALLKANKKEWLGPLAPVVGGALVFRRGFLAEATVKFRHQRDVEQYGSLPEWATVEEAEWGDQLVRDDQMEWSRFIGPAMRHLRIARGPMAKFLLVDGEPWNFEELELWRGDSSVELFHQICASPRLAKLKMFSANSYAQPSWLEGATRFPPSLKVWMRMDAPEWDEWRKQAKNTNIETLVFHDWSTTEYRFSRPRGSPSGAFTELAVVIRGRSKIKTLKPVPTELQTVVTILGKQLPAGSITSFDAKIEVQGELVEATPAMKVGLAKI